MFGNRKRKPQDEEESLVPHGLIWHATEEPTPEEVAKNEESLGFTVDYAQEIERVRRGLSEPPADPTPEVPAARPAVIPWWRVQQPESSAEIPKSKLTPMPLSAYHPTPIEPNVEPPRSSRIQPMQIRPMPAQPMPVQPTLVAPVEIKNSAAQAREPKPTEILPLPVPETRTAEIQQAFTPRIEGSLATSSEIRVSQPAQPVLKQPELHRPPINEPLVPKSRATKESFRLAFSRFSSVCQTVWLELVSIGAKAKEQSLQRARSLELGRQLSGAGKQGQHLVRGGLSRTSHYVRTAGAVVGSYSRSGIARVRQASLKVRASSASAGNDVVRPANYQSATPSRIRVLFAASVVRARIMAAQQLSAWRIRREQVAIDSRFWTSMTMGAIAAVLALVIVSLVPHFAARSLPSRILNTNPSVDANVVPRATAPAAQVKTMTAAQKRTTAVSQPAQAKATSNKPATTISAEKPRRVVHDDYVARDTYKYYGNASKPSR